MGVPCFSVLKYSEQYVMLYRYYFKNRLMEVQFDISQ